MDAPKMARKAKPVPDTAATMGHTLHPVPNAPEVLTVHSRRVACEGVGGALGHPRVWLELGVDGVAECGYCDRRFVLAAHSDGHEDERLAPGVFEDAASH
jgi:uncharacterized Zn-finger protein